MGSPTLPRRLRPGRRRSTIPVLADHLLSSWEGARTLRPTSAKLGHALVELTAPVQFFCGRGNPQAGEELRDGMLREVRRKVSQEDVLRGIDLGSTGEYNIILTARPRGSLPTAL